jgi:hypothetical protein
MHLELMDMHAFAVLKLFDIISSTALTTIDVYLPLTYHMTNNSSCRRSYAVLEPMQKVTFYFDSLTQGTAYQV